MAVNIEKYIPTILYNGLNSAKNGILSGIFTFSGANTHSGIEEHTGAETHSGAETHAGVEDFTSIGPVAAVSAEAATITVTRAAHAGGVIALTRAAGVTATLPAATGTGCIYRFVIATAATSNANIIQVANATDVMNGSLNIQADDDADGTLKCWMAEVGDDTMTFAGAATTGGIAGNKIECIDYKAGFWACTAHTISSGGSEVTPFSAAVA